MASGPDLKALLSVFQVATLDFKPVFVVVDVLDGWCQAG